MPNTLNRLTARWSRYAGALLLCGLVGLDSAGARAATATTFFVRSSGNDTNDGLTPQTAFASIRHAGDFLLNPGDRVVVGSGDYHEGNIEPRRGGSDGAPTVFVADTTGALTGDPAGPVQVLPDNSAAATTGFILFGERHVRIEGFTVVGAADAGIQIRPSAQTGGSSADIAIVANVLRNNRYGIQAQAAGPVVITDNDVSANGIGITLDGEFGSSTDATLSGNHFMGNGIIASGVHHAQFENNTIIGNADACIQVAPSAQSGDSSTDISMIGNMVSNCRYGIQLQAAGAVVITDNDASGNWTDLRLEGDLVAGTDATVTGNQLTGTSTGIVALAMRHAQFENNTLQGHTLAASLVGDGDLVFQQNTLRQCARGIRLSGFTTVTFTDNLMENCGGIAAGIQGPMTFSRNTVHQVSVVSLGSTAVSGSITAQQNELRGGYVFNVAGSSVALQNNLVSGYANGLETAATVRADILGNEIDGGRFTITAPQIVVQANQLSAVDRTILRGDVVSVDANRIQGALSPVSIVDAVDVDITNNQVDGPAAGLWYRTSHQQRGSVRFMANTVQSGDLAILVGNSTAAPAADVVVTGNVVTGPAKTAIWIVTTGSAEITQNTVTQPGGDGISLQLDRNASAALITGNTVTGGASGIFVDGARNATLQGNTINAPTEFGCLVRNADTVDVDTNHVQGSGNDAINVAGDAILFGDCDRNGTVTADDIERALHRLFDSDVAADCSALGPNRNGDVSVASLVAALINATEQPAGRQPSGRVDIHDNVLEQIGGVGILAYAADQLTLQGNTTRKPGHTGISATGTPAARMVLQANTIEDSGDDCILISGGAAAQVIGGSASTCAGTGVRIRDTTAVTFDGNQVSVAAETAVLATRVGSWSSSGNLVSDGAGGIAVIGGQSASLDGDQVERSGGAGVLISSTNIVAVSDCQVLDSALDSIAVRRSDSVQLVGNTLAHAGASGVTIGTAAEPVTGDVVLDSNQIADFHAAGIDAYASARLPVLAKMLVLGNQVHATPSSSGAGVSIRYPLDAGGVADVAGNRIRAGRGDGIHLENATRVFVWDNVVFSSAQNGVLVRGTQRSEVVNTLAYANAQQGILLEQPGTAHVSNNTLYGNGLWGLMSTGANHLLLINNIFDRNASGSVTIGPNDRAATDERFNLTTGAYSGLSLGQSDIIRDPQFVDPAGPDGVLGGDGADDDDFHLSTGGTGEVSPAIDAGSDTAEVLGISGTTAEDGIPDTGPVDLGYHYDASPRVP